MAIKGGPVDHGSFGQLLHGNSRKALLDGEVDQGLDEQLAGAAYPQIFGLFLVVRNECLFCRLDDIESDFEG